MDVASFLKLIWPMIIIQVILQVFALVDVIKKKKTNNLSVPVWIIIILLGEILGAVIYYLIGRAEE